MEISFAAYDKLGQKPFADRLTKAITSFYPLAEEAYVLSLNAKFGSGKTTFLKMWQTDLTGQGFKVIYLNAWETDFDEDPIIPLTSSLLDYIESGKGAQKAKNALRGVLGATALVGNKILEQATGIDVYQTIKSVEKDLKDSDLQEIGKELYKSYNFKLSAYRKLKDELSAYVEGLDKKPLIILVDELDRVRPDYAVKFLEAIKHIFSVHGICFVLAVDRDQLECSVRQLYGNVDFENYYRRFITREASLAIPKNLDLIGFVRQLGNEYFDAKALQDISFCFEPNKRDPLLNEIARISKIFNFTLREIQSMFRIFAHFTAVESNNKNFGIYSWLYATVLLIAIMIKNPTIYHGLGNKAISAKELYNYLSLLSYSKDDNDQKKYLRLAFAFNLRTDDDINDTKTAEIWAEFTDIVIQEADRPRGYGNTISGFARLLNDFGTIGRESGFQSIYAGLEEWRSFLE